MAPTSPRPEKYSFHTKLVIIAGNLYGIGLLVLFILSFTPYVTLVGDFIGDGGQATGWGIMGLLIGAGRSLMSVLSLWALLVLLPVLALATWTLLGTKGRSTTRTVAKLLIGVASVHIGIILVQLR